jgi:DNA polymerase-3 subunit gamma/tau
MLKTLEEPPDYVKFILATTDPQKIPVTVLSRCLQFNLKQMPMAQIVPHLEEILGAEGIAFEKTALPLLARGAAGSMRDALSLTDQAIAYSGTNVTEEAVRNMLGTLDQTYLLRILEALAQSDGPGMLAVADEIAERSLSYASALQDLASLLHRIAILQSIPDIAMEEGADAATLRGFAETFSAEEIQLDYDIVTRGRSELALAPDEYAGFTMTLLRLLAFRPEEPTPRAFSSETQKRPADAVRAPSSRATSAETRLGPVTEESLASTFRTRPAVPIEAQPKTTRVALQFDGDWLGLTKRIRVLGLARQLLEQAELARFEGNAFHLRVPIKSLLEANTLEKLQTALEEHFGSPVKVTAELGAVKGPTVAAADQSERAKRQAQAEAAIEADPFVRALVNEFGATIVPGSIKPARQDAQ